MPLSRDTLRGYLLEEIIAFLIQTTGYRLLESEKQDPQELDWRHNGLVVKGRGGVHQVDVLGELSWIPAFTYPLRLFVEAKFRGAKTGIAEVRNMVGTLLDVNQSNLPRTTREAGARPQLRPKYYYAGAIFSASGFSTPATDMALAHGVSLIELNTPELQPLLTAITVSADDIINEMWPSPLENASDEAGALVGNPPDAENGQTRSVFVSGLRTILRTQLGTNTASRQEADKYNLPDHVTRNLKAAIDEARRIGQLFVGVGHGPFMWVLQADDPTAFIEFCQNRPSHNVRISRSRTNDGDSTWSVSPIPPTNADGSYRLTFRLPAPIRDWVLSADPTHRPTLDPKERLTHSISIVHVDRTRDLTIRLRFNPDEIPRI